MADAAIETLKKNTRPIEPPAHLKGDVRRVFCETIASVSPSHFSESDAPIIEAYAMAYLSVRNIEEFDRWEKAARLLASLATRLRLTPQSRYDSRAAGRKAGEAPSGHRRPWED